MQNKMGNLTGIGEIPMAGDRFREINFALHLNDFFAFYHEQMPELQWIYYTSNSDFINLYPWTPSDEFFYRPILKDVPFLKLLRQREILTNHWNGLVSTWIMLEKA